MTIANNNILPYNFTAIECIKKSEYGGVYLAFNSANKKVIVKILDAGNADEDSKNRFVREAKILSKIEHPNVIKIIDWNSDADKLFIAFEYFKSNNLRYLLNGNSLSSSQKESIVFQLLKGLSFLHENNIIHRDLKPENILVDDKLRLKISDFGLAVLLEDEFETKMSSIVGTPCYMSPEQIQGKKLSFKSDLFSTGTILYELYTGKNLFLSENFNQTINNILNFNIHKVHDELTEFCPPKIIYLMEKLLTDSPDVRIESAAEAITILKEDIRILPFKNRITFKKILLSAAAVVILILIYIFTFGAHSKQIPRTVKNSNIDIPTINKELQNELVSKQEIQNDSADKSPDDLTKQKTEVIKPIAEYKTVSEEPEKIIADKPAELPGKLLIETYPWSYVYLNDSLLGLTPFEKPVELPPGEYPLSLIHPDYPKFNQNINITGDSLTSLTYNLNDLYGYLKCKVFPWGNVYVDNKLLGQTPLSKLVILKPGLHSIEIKNPNYSSFTKKLLLHKMDTISVDINFEELMNSN